MVVRGEKSMRERFIVSPNLLPEDRRAGFTCEVVDSTHPSDGGPVAIASCRTREDADAITRVLNAFEKL